MTTRRWREVVQSRSVSVGRERRLRRRAQMAELRDRGGRGGERAREPLVKKKCGKLSNFSF